MKKFITTILAIAGLAITASAQIGYSGYATPGTAINAGTNYAIISPASINGGEPLVTYLNMNALFASGSSTLTAYVSTNQTTAQGPNTTTTLNVVSTNGFTAGQWVVIEHLSVANLRFRNEAAIISSVNANGTNIVLATAPTTALVAGDVVNAQTSWATIPLASSTTAREINGPGIVSGQRREPFLLTLVGSGVGTNTINAVNSVFIP